MDYKENKLYYFIKLELLRLKNLTKSFGEEQSKVLRTVPTNGKYFFPDNADYVRQLSRSYQRLLKSKKKTGGNHAFFRDNCTSIWRKTLNRRFLEKG